MLEKNLPMTLQKKWIVFILLMSCISSALLLISIPKHEDQSLKNLDEIDYLIQSVLANIDTNEKTVRRTAIQVDSIFSRKHYQINTVRDFPITAFHAQLALPLQEKNVFVTGTRHFPERTLKLRFIYGTKVVRTVELNPTL